MLVILPNIVSVFSSKIHGLENVRKNKNIYTIILFEKRNCNSCKSSDPIELKLLTLLDLSYICQSGEEIQKTKYDFTYCTYTVFCM